MRAIFLIVLFLMSSIVHAAELATVMGKPSPVVARDMISERINLIGSSEVNDSSTYAYSVLYQQGIRSTISIEVMNQSGASLADFREGLLLAAEKSPVVYTILGPVLSSICTYMADLPETSFVVVSGNDGVRLDPEQYSPACKAPNILRVAALDQDTQRLMSFANWGPLMRIAAPGKSILVENIDGRTLRTTGTTVASSQVAARLALFARAKDLRGGDLIKAFLDAESIILPSLRPFIHEGRILADRTQK